MKSKIHERQLKKMNSVSKKIFLFAVSVSEIIFAQDLSAQNLVPNYSFEATDTCPAGVSSLVYSTYWYSASAGTPDYFDSCATSAWVDVPNNYFGWQQARTGESYAGFYAFYSSFPNYREYAEVHLTSPLVAGTEYYLSFYVSLADSMMFATDDFGMYLSADSLSSWGNSNFAVTPQLENPEGTFVTDTAMWIREEGTFIALGGEKFLTLGNFKDGASTDSLRVRFIDLATATAQYTHAYYYVDDVCVSANPAICGFPIGGINESKNSLLNISSLDGNVFSVNIPGSENQFQLSVVNMLGEKCDLKIISQNKNQVSFQVEDAATGIYFVQFLTANKKYIGKIIVK